MKRKRYTEEQIIGILKEHEAGVTVQELVRQHGMSEQSFYRWKSKYGGMEVSEAKRLRELEADGIIHRKVYAEVPPKVEYSLTDVGESLRDVMMLMRDWGRNHFGL